MLLSHFALTNNAESKSEVPAKPIGLWYDRGMKNSCPAPGRGGPPASHLPWKSRPILRREARFQHERRYRASRWWGRALRETPAWSRVRDCLVKNSRPNYALLIRTMTPEGIAKVSRLRFCVRCRRQSGRSRTLVPAAPPRARSSGRVADEALRVYIVFRAPCEKCSQAGRRMPCLP